MSGIAVYNPSEIYLDGTYFPIWGQVRRTILTPFPPKMTIGDYTRDSRIIESSWVLSDFSGGLGILIGKLPEHQDRFWFSDLSTTHRHLTLNRLFTSVLVDGVEPAGPIQLAADYNGTFVAVINNSVHLWNETSGQFDAASHTLDGEPNGSALFDGNIYIVTDTTLYEFDGATWTEAATGGYDLVTWDDKLFRLGTDQTTNWSITPMDDQSWTENGKLPVPAGEQSQLLVYFDLTGEPAIHAITKTGVYGYEFDSGKWYPTPLTYPRSDDAGSGATVWRGILWVPTGESLYRYDGNTIQVSGPTKDDGLPARVRGPIRQVVPSHGFLFCVMEAVDTSATGTALSWDEHDINVSNPLTFINPLDPMSTTEKIGTVLATTEASWHGVRAQHAGTAVGESIAVSTDGNYRLWVSDDTGIYHTDLSTELHNPLQQTINEFAETGELETYWSDMGWTEIDKLALWLEVTARDVDDDNTITFEIAWDEEDDYETLGTVTESGKSYFHIGGDSGKIFQSVRLRITMNRGDDETKTPVMQSALLSFLRRPDLVWGWEIEIQATETHHGLNSEDLVNRLYEIARNKEAMDFVFTDHEGFERRARVVTSRLTGAEIGGEMPGGRYTLSVIEIVDPEQLEEL